MAFADRLREIMEARGIDQVALAKAVGVESQAVSQWVSRIKPTQPVGKRLPIIADALRVTVPELMAGVGEPFGDAATLTPTLLLPNESSLISLMRTMPKERAKAIFTLAGVDGKPSTQGGAPERKRHPPPRPTLGGNVQENQISAECRNVVPLKAPGR